MTKNSRWKKYWRISRILRKNAKAMIMLYRKTYRYFIKYLFNFCFIIFYSESLFQSCTRSAQFKTSKVTSGLGVKLICFHKLTWVIFLRSSVLMSHWGHIKLGTKKKSFSSYFTKNSWFIRFRNRSLDAYICILLLSCLYLLIPSEIINQSTVLAWKLKYVFLNT